MSHRNVTQPVGEFTMAEEHFDIPSTANPSFSLDVEPLLPLDVVEVLGDPPKVLVEGGPVGGGYSIAGQTVTLTGTYTQGVDNLRIAYRIKPSPFKGSAALDTFARMFVREFKDGEEARYDVPEDLTNAALFIGLATAGSATSQAVWSVVRVDFDANALPARARFRAGITWDDRAAGWT